MSSETILPCQHESPYLRHFEWADVAEFVAAFPTIQDGLHSVGLERGYHLDVMLRDSPLDPSRGTVSVFFGGAVTSRATKTPPFLSGAKVSKNVGLPLISFADPTLTMDQELSLAWYLGPAGVDVQGAMAQILRAVIDQSGNTLWLVGGSGGGFAALQTAQRVGPGCNAFVWNAQTVVFDYSESFVKRFLRIAYPDLAPRLRRADWKQLAARALSANGVVWSLPDHFREGITFDRLLYVQNWNDWHVQRHALPWLHSVPGVRQLQPGIYGPDDDHVLWLTQAGNGHAPPTTEMVEAILTAAAFTADSMRGQADWHVRTGLMPSDKAALYVADLRPQRDLVERAVQFTFTEGQTITPTSTTLPDGFGGMELRYELYHGNAVLDSATMGLGQSYVAAQPQRPWDRVLVTALDGFGHDLFETTFLNPTITSQ